jgi:hypothetical protein
MIFEHARHAIFNISQHPYKHDFGDFLYSNNRLPGITTPNEALDYIVACLYPNYKGTVANPAALPLVGNTVNDYRLVSDDGDGKAAGYVWINNEGVQQWMKRYDVDWSMDALLTETVNRTFPMYVARDGFNQLDANGVEIVGDYAGQTIYGGATSGTNLTLNANRVAANGYVQTDNILRPTTDGTLDLGQSDHKWLNVYGTTVYAGTLAVASGSITDTSGAISFGNENLSTTGNVTAAIGYFTSSLEVGPLLGDSLILAAGSITDESGVISFGNENLSTTGTLASGTLTVSADIVIGVGSITSASGEIDFGNEDLVTLGTIYAGSIVLSSLSVDNLLLDGNTITTTNANGNLILDANGSGSVDIQAPLITLGQTVTGVVGVTGQLNVDSIRIDGSTISDTVNGESMFLMVTGSADLYTNADTIRGSVTNDTDLGNFSYAFKNIHFAGYLTNNATTFTNADLFTLRNTPFRDAGRTQAVQHGDTLFWDSVSGTWLANHPDTEITHNQLSGLTTTDAGHTQFAMLAGRAGGQTVQGGTAASELLVLESTAHATKGFVVTKDDFRPYDDAVYSGGWTGVDLGNASYRFNDLFMAGEAKGLRVENFTNATLPAFSGQSIGRLTYTTDTKKFYVDTGAEQLLINNSNRYVTDTVWNGTDVTKTVTVTGVTDCRNMIWVLKNNSDNFKQMAVEISALSATQVKIDVAPALPAGSYRLVGLE